MNKISRVIWRDSNIYLKQCSIDDDFTYETIVSYGKTIQEDDEQITLAGDTIREKDVRRVIVIPKENIISIKKYRE